MSKIGSLLALCLLLMAGAVTAQVYTWVGQSGDWEDISNWELAGKVAGKVPGADDHVVVAASAPIGITLNGPVSIGSLTALGESSLVFESSQAVQLKVSGHLHLTPNTAISGALELYLYGGAGSLYTPLSARAEALQIENPSHYQATEPLGSAMASCAFFTLVPEVTNPTCNGSADGVAGVEEPADGVGPFTYQWVGGPSTRLWSGVGAGTYTVIVIDQGQGGLPCSEDIFVNEPGPLTVFSMNGTAPTCATSCDGQATPVIIGGNGGYELSWSSGETGPAADALCATFTLEVEDQLGCTFSTEFTFPDTPDPIVSDAEVEDIVCFGDSNGSIDADVSGGTGALTFEWSGPGGFSATTPNISGLAPGEYNLTATDANGCETSFVYTIAETTEIFVTGTVIDNQCSGDQEGEIAIAVTGGEPPYIFSWQGPAGFTSDQQNLTNLLSGTYALELTDENGCVYTDSFEVTAPDQIDVEVVTTDVPCSGDPTGSAQASASSGTAPYTYAWTGPGGFFAAGAAITELEAGTYTLEVTDANGCTIETTVLINEPTEVILDVDVDPISCVGSADGAITAIPEGGVAPYTFAWTGPGGFASDQASISDLSQGSYNITATDANGCTASQAVELEDPEGINIVPTTTPPSCADGSDGSIEVVVSGGTEPYGFSWTGPSGFSSSNQNLSNIASGSYTVLVADDAGCAETLEVTLDNPAGLGADFVIEPTECFGASTGSVQTTPLNGTAPFSYLWIGTGGFLSTSQNISNLQAGTYTLQLTDANGCSGFFEAIVAQPAQIQVTRVITNASCFGSADGAISISAGGGTPPYTYSWSGPDDFTATTQNISGVVAGSYTVVVTDVNGCVRIRVFTINQPAEIIFNGSVTNATCAGDNDGAIALNLTSGAGPFTFAWSGPDGFASTAQNISGLFAGSYTVIATNNQGCTGEFAFEIEESVVINLSADVTNIGCFGDGDGAVDLTIDGGVPPLQIAWSGPDGFVSDQTLLDNLQPGDYTVVVTDDFGCQASATYEVLSPALLEALAEANQITCAGEGDGSISTVIAGGNPPYTLSWTGPAGFTSEMEDISGLEAGVYDLEIIDALGCTASAQVEVAEPEELTLSIEAVEPACLENDGSLTAVVSGGTVETEYTYTWTNSSGVVVGTTPTIQDLAPGTYTAVVEDDNGCSATQSIQLFRESINLSALSTNATCAGGSDGTLSIMPQSGTPPFTYSWTGPGGFTSDQPSISGLAAGQYALVVTDDAGCVLNESYDISEPLPIAIDAVVVQEGCPGAANGQIALTVTGGTPGFLFSWTGPEGYTGAGANATGLIAGTYTVQVTDTNGCEESIEIELGVADEIDVVLMATDPACADDATGVIGVDISGGEAPFQYAWNGPNGFTSADDGLVDLLSGTYTLTVTDAAGCEATEEVTLVEPDPIEAELTIEGATCQELNGSAEVTAIGGTGDLTYSWTDGAGTVISVGVAITDVASGLYFLEVTDEVGCTLTLNVPISDTDAEIAGELVPTSCPDGDDGAINIEVIGGTAPFEFAWTGPNGFTSVNQNISDLPIGTYAVAVTDSSGCIYAAEFEISGPEPLMLVADVGLVTCNGDDGSLILTATGGTPEYALSWTGPDGFTATGPNLSGLVAGTYFAALVDANGCEASMSFDVGLVPEIVVVADLISPLCGGENEGSIDIAISGGSPPYAVLWAGPEGFVANETSLTGLAGGVYELTVIDLAGCEFTDTYVLDQPDIIEIDLEAIAPDCGEENGSIAATITGGVAAGPYFINWSNAAGDTFGGANPIEDIGPGTYIITVVDDNGCGQSSSFDLANPGIEVVAEVTDVTCFGGDDGAIILTIIADNPPVDIEWTGPGGFAANTPDIESLAPGDYAYTATAADGCETTGNITVNEPLAISAQASIQPACFGEENGAIVLTVENATPELAVSWSGPNGFASNELPIGTLAPGVYSVSITDGLGCGFAADYNVEENDEILVTLDAANATCAGGTDGSVSPTTTGGTPPYQFSWSGPDGFASDDETITGLLSGLYILLLTDSVGCSVFSEIEITEPSAIVAEEIVILPECGSTTGLSSILLEISGGAAPYSVAWTGPDGFEGTGESIFELPHGMYVYTVTDAAGCTLEGGIEIPEIFPLSVNADLTEASCFGVADGAINIEVSGGVGAVEASWSGPEGFTAEGFAIEELEAGTYQLLLTDSLGCTLEASFDLGAPEAVIIEVDEVSDASCNTTFDGSIGLAIAGGTSPYTVSWVGPNGFGAEGSIIDSLAFGTYTAEVVDANGCVGAIDVEVDFVFEITANAGDDLTICQSALPFEVIGLSEGGDDFSWFDQVGVQVSDDSFLPISGLTPGFYFYVFQATNGICTASDTVEVEILPLPEADAGGDFDVFIEEVFVLGGNPTSPTGVSYQWSPGALGDFDITAPNPTGFIIESTTFTVIVTDENGCQSSDSVLVTIIPSVVISSGFTPNDDGVNDAWIIDNIELFSNSLVSVFNRWGQLVYRQRAYNAGNAWDGTYEGSPLPIGTYYYTIELNDPRFPEPFTGPITIYR